MNALKRTIASAAFCECRAFANVSIWNTCQTQSTYSEHQCIIAQLHRYNLMLRESANLKCLADFIYLLSLKAILAYELNIFGKIFNWLVAYKFEASFLQNKK